MNTFKKIAAIGLTIVALQTITSLAGVNAQESLFATLDTNRDGQLSLREAAGHFQLLEKFNEIDLNEDGYISMDELSSSRLSEG